MRPDPFPALALCLALLPGCSRGTPAPQPPRLEGAWLILSIDRNGVPDPAHVGAQLRFQGERITLQPKVAGPGSYLAPAEFSGTPSDSPMNFAS